MNGCKRSARRPLIDSKPCSGRSPADFGLFAAVSRRLRAGEPAGCGLSREMGNIAPEPSRLRPLAGCIWKTQPECKMHDAKSREFGGFYIFHCASFIQGAHFIT